jgi:hypothetical protein
MILDMGDEDDVHLILGRLFLNTTSVIIYMKSRQIHFQFPAEKVFCYFNSYTSYEQPKKNRSRSHRSQRQKKQITKDGWADYAGEVSRYEDHWNDEPEKNESPLEEVTPPTDTPIITICKEEESKKDKPQKESPQSKKVWKKKERTPSDTSTQGKV